MKGITPQERLEKWNAAICAQKASGLTIKEWCEQNGINSNTYYYYLRRIRDAMLESSGPCPYTSMHPENASGSLRDYFSTTKASLYEHSSKLRCFSPIKIIPD